MAVWKGTGAVSFIVDVDSDRLKDYREPVALLGLFNEVLRESVKTGRIRSEVVRLTVELLSCDADETLLNARVSQVAGDLLDSEQVGLGLEDGVDVLPKVAVRAIGRRRVPVEERLEAVDDCFVVDEDVDWAFRGGHEVAQGEGFGSLCILDETVHAG